MAINSPPAPVKGAQVLKVGRYQRRLSQKPKFVFFYFGSLPLFRYMGTWLLSCSFACFVAHLLTCAFMVTCLLFRGRVQKLNYYYFHRIFREWGGVPPIHENN